MTGDAGADRGVPKVRVLLGAERFSSQHSWSELTALMPAELQATVDVQWCPSSAFTERARGELVNVVVPLWAELDAETIHAGKFGLIQQFGAGVENIDIAAATSAGVWVANMPGLNAVDVAEHAVLLLLALLRRLPESQSGFDPGHWGDPPGEALAGSTVCIVGLGAVGSQVARRLEPFDVRLIGVRRAVHRRAPPTTPDIEIVVTSVTRLGSRSHPAFACPGVRMLSRTDTPILPSAQVVTGYSSPASAALAQEPRELEPCERIAAPTGLAGEEGLSPFASDLTPEDSPASHTRD